jgi:hypothetical protein
MNQLTPRMFPYEKNTIYIIYIYTRVPNIIYLHIYIHIYIHHI